MQHSTVSRCVVVRWCQAWHPRVPSYTQTAYLKPRRTCTPALRSTCSLSLTSAREPCLDRRSVLIRTIWSGFMCGLGDQLLESSANALYVHVWTFTFERKIEWFSALQLNCSLHSVVFRCVWYRAACVKHASAAVVLQNSCWVCADSRGMSITV